MLPEGVPVSMFKAKSAACLAESVSMVATDGHRLALAEQRKAVGGVSSELRMLVPSKAVGQLSCGYKYNLMPLRV